MSVPGVVYLVHLVEPIAHARHYLGWAKRLDARIAHHRAGSGSKLLAEAARRGIAFEVVKTWSGDRHLERRLKKQKHSWRHCPVCRAERKR